MKMITDSLEKVYTAMGGADEFDKTDIANGIEQISEVAGSGGSGSVFIPYTDDPNNSGFEKSREGGVATLFTYAEIEALYEQSNGLLFCFYGQGGDSAHNLVRVDKIGDDMFRANIVDIYPPTSAEDTACGMYTGTITLTASDGYSCTFHGWSFTITNED